MTLQKKRLKVGILGCGAIGSRIALSVTNELKNECELSGIYDIDEKKAKELQKNISTVNLAKYSLIDLIKSCELMVEAIDAEDTRSIIKQALESKKHVLAMSVGKLLNLNDLLNLADKNNRQLLLPSGAIAGLDAIKAASLVPTASITLTTRKPPSSLTENHYIREQGIDLSTLDKETVIFDGDVEKAVELFPKNINVAAALALASNAINKIRVRIIASPDFDRNSHEIEMIGDFGRIQSRTDNIPCPDNPKTSYLAVLSGIQTLKQFCHSIKIGT